MKKIVLFCLALLLTTLPSALYSRDLSQYYMSYISNKGLLFFIKPRVMPVAKNSNAIKKMKYDVTCPIVSDSIFYTVTVYTGMPLASNDVNIFLQDGSEIHTEFEKIFVDNKNAIWVHRLRFYLTFSDYKKLYAFEEPYIIFFGDKQEQLTYGFPKSKWKKELQIANGIIRLMELNR